MQKGLPRPAVRKGTVHARATYCRRGARAVGVSIGAALEHRLLRRRRRRRLERGPGEIGPAEMQELRAFACRPVTISSLLATGRGVERVLPRTQAWLLGGITERPRGRIPSLGQLWGESGLGPTDQLRRQITAWLRGGLPASLGYTRPREKAVLLAVRARREDQNRLVEETTRRFGRDVRMAPGCIPVVGCLVNLVSGALGAGAEGQAEKDVRKPVPSTLDRNQDGENEAGAWAVLDEPRDRRPKPDRRVASGI